MDPSRDPSPERGDSPHRNPTRGPSVTDGKHRSALSSQLYAQPDHGSAKTATWVVAIADTASATVMGNHGPLLRITSIRKPTLRRQPTRPLGPFAVTQVMSSGNAVKLDLPPTIRVAHATFNLSQLREHVARPADLGPSAPAPATPVFRDAVTGEDFWDIDLIVELFEP